MNNQWPYPGSRWWKFDFHTHTPASHDTPWHRETLSLSAKDWLLRYMAAEIDCVAVTDHNSGAWIDKLKETYADMQANPPEGFRDLHLFPGVEISVNGGFHLLAIFDTTATTRDIDTLLGRVGYDGSKGDCNAVTHRGASEVIEAVLAAGGLPIPAHADGENGLLQVQSSFSYTWVKMAEPSLEGLRLALLDGNGISIRRSDEGDFDPFKTPENFITRIEIEHARYMGNGKPQTLELTPFYNALIGGRGTGKSTLIHALRLAYRRDNEIKHLNAESEPRKQFERFIRTISGRSGEGALRENTELRVELMRDGVSHRLRWRADGQGTVVEILTPEGASVSSSQAVTPERFPIRIFSQGQIAALAGDDRQALLDVIDEAALVAPLQRAFDEAKRTYFAQRARLRELDGQLIARPETERKLADLTRKLETFTQSHHAEVLKAHQRVIRQQREVSQSLEQLAAMPQRIETLAQDLLLDDWPEGTFDAVSDVDALAWRQTMDRYVKQAREALEQAALMLSTATQPLHQDEQLATWRTRSETANARYATLKATLSEQGVQDPQAFGRLEQERQSLEVQIKQYGKSQQDRDQLQVDIDRQWESVFRARRTITEARQAFLSEKLQNNAFVRMAIEPFGYDTKVIERSLRALLDVTDDRFESDILLLQNGSPVEGIVFDIVQTSEREGTLETIKQRLLNIDTAFGDHFRKYLQKKNEKAEFSDHIHCWFPEDDLRIEYSRNGKGSDFTSITQGSPGQRAAALLAFLLAFGDEPLVLDQPEDDLDNHLIYELIVSQIRQNKRRRQLIVVTHNPNVVVNGDAEMVHAFEFGNGQCYVQKAGALQNESVREEVCHVMEGGHEAFARRWSRLGKGI
ncbi:MAG: AAA family ATPase [Rhodocyclaceae bacterium]|nr:AAA family ATPase [Rhodocyclaceae bacterium]